MSGIKHIIPFASFFCILTVGLNTGMQRSAGTSVQVHQQYKDAVDVKKDIKHQIAANVKKATIEILLITLASVSD